MRNVDASIEDTGPAENDVLLAEEVVLLDPLEGSDLEPDEIHDTTSVSEMSNEMAFASVPFLLEAQNFTHHLNKRHVGRQFVDIVEPRAVDVLVREVVQQIAERGDS